MIFIKPENNQSIFISKHNLADGPFKLVLTNNLSNEVFEFPDLIDQGYKSGYWIFTNMDFRYLTSGEYTYSLIAANGYQKETGLLQVMTVLNEPITYKKDNNTIIYGN